jgi:hypothetical protein
MKFPQSPDALFDQTQSLSGPEPRVLNPAFSRFSGIHPLHRSRRPSR